MLDYGKYCLDKANKHRLFIEKNSARDDYHVELLDDAVKVCCRFCQRKEYFERNYPSKKASKLAVFTTFIWMKTDNLNLAEICEQLTSWKCRPTRVSLIRGNYLVEN
jgi:hypothetical protein